MSWSRGAYSFVPWTVDDVDEITVAPTAIVLVSVPSNVKKNK